MDGGSTDTAVARIEAAITRIERVLDSHGQAAFRTASPDFEALRTRHERLKAAVANSLGRIDDLIAEQRG
ncbi:MAG TPA: hypothetical protein VJM34_14765 [Novosphingobium sp.]|nr:hypothetical protein [Novosphingobium sp.]